MKSLLSATVLILSTAVNAQSGLSVKQLSIFKNQTALTVKDGTLNAKDGKIQLPVPSSVLYGTYWLASGKETAIRRIEFLYDTLKTARMATEIGQLLAGNPGKEVAVLMRTGETDKKWTGKIESMGSGAKMLRLATASGVVFLPVNMIQWIEFTGSAGNTYLADSISKVANVWVDQSGPVNLKEVYLQQNFNWVPSYQIKLGEDQTARLEMKATVENNAEAVTNASLQLVVGSPQMYFGSRLDPISSESITSGGMELAQMNAYNGYMPMAAKSMQMADAGGREQYTTEGEKTEDLYVYKLGNVTLPYQSKVLLPIFGKDIPFRDKYDCVIPDQTNYYATRYIDAAEREYPTYHSIELSNKTGMPLTSASIMVMDSKDRFLAQDNLSYIPEGAKGDIRLSTAIDVLVKNNEEEVKRDEEVKKIGKVTYGRVVIHGTITLENFQNKTITHTLKKQLNGEVTKVSDGGKMVNRNPYRSINPNAEITWEQVVKPGEKKQLSYSYEVLFPVN